MNNKKIRFSIPIDVTRALLNAMEPNETIDQTVERYLRIAFKAEGKL